MNTYLACRCHSLSAFLLYSFFFLQRHGQRAFFIRFRAIMQKCYTYMIVRRRSANPAFIFIGHRSFSGSGNEIVCNLVEVAKIRVIMHCTKESVSSCNACTTSPARPAPRASLAPRRPEALSPRHWRSSIQFSLPSLSEGTGRTVRAAHRLHTCSTSTC